MEGTNYYFDANVFKKCYTDCATCSTGGNANDMKCNTCAGSKPYFAEPHNCIADITHYYHDSTQKIYKKFYTDCNTCFAGGNVNDMKCKSCSGSKPYLAEPNNCIADITHYYYDSTQKIYKKCYSDCNTCFAGGNANDMKCKICSGSKPYLAEHNNCIADITHYYYDSTQKIYKKCYTNCHACFAGGNTNDMKCKSCSGTTPNLAEPNIRLC